ncbi:WD repeat-containing protein 91 [Spatholobus suberectus]|nr:WD repeat-containing protein 91 [Spatholobus suberectus]
MEKMQHAEELVREFLVFRGFTNTLEAYEAELRTDIGKGFEADKDPRPNLLRLRSQVSRRQAPRAPRFLQALPVFLLRDAARVHALQVGGFSSTLLRRPRRSVQPQGQGRRVLRALRHRIVAAVARLDSLVRNSL